VFVAEERKGPRQLVQGRRWIVRRVTVYPHPEPSLHGRGVDLPGDRGSIRSMVKKRKMVSFMTTNDPLM